MSVRSLLGGIGTELGDERRPGGAPRELEFDR